MLRTLSRKANIRFPAYPVVTGKSLINNLKDQIKPFRPELFTRSESRKTNYKEKEFVCKTSVGNLINSKCIFIAAGNGAFGPNKPPLEDIDKYENISIFYSVNDKERFRNKNIAIAGGGDSAVDWAIELSNIAKKVFYTQKAEA